MLEPLSSFRNLKKNYKEDSNDAITKYTNKFLKNITTNLENFSYNNNSNKFELKQYEKEIENNLINKIVEKSILYFSELQK